MKVILALLIISFASIANASNERAVRFLSGSTSLVGTLVLPQRDPAEAVLVLLHGSSRRDSVRMLALARALAEDQFAVFTYDKRGIGESSGVFQDADDTFAFAILADDAAAAAQATAAQPELRNVPLGILGISQGGWIAPLVTQRRNDVSFLVLWSGPVVSVGEELHFSKFARDIDNFERDRYSSAVKKHMSETPPRANDFDPRPVLREITQPALWVFGGRDNSIPVDLSIERLRALIAAGRRNFDYHVLPEGIHSLSYPDRFTIDWMKQHAADASANTRR